MELYRPIQRCVSNQPYFTQEIPSRSQDDLVYSVYSPFIDDPVEDYVCSCQGFAFRGRCAHQDMAYFDRCRWSEDEGPEEQSKEERRAFRCPRCGQATYQVLVKPNE